MKKIILLLSVLVTLASCQKKEYASFQKNGSVNYAAVKKNAGKSSPAVEVSAEKTVVAPTEAKIADEFTVSNAVVEESKLALASNRTVLSEDEINSVLSQKNEVKASKTTAGKKITSVKLKIVKAALNKKLNLKAKKSNTTSTVAEKVDTLSLLSLIFGGLGLILMFTGIGGILFGIAGFVLGLLALRKRTPNRTMAILGTVFGAIAVLVALLVVTILATALLL